MLCYSNGTDKYTECMTRLCRPTHCWRRTKWHYRTCKNICVKYKTTDAPHSSASSLPSPQWSYPSHLTVLGRHRLFLHLKSVADLHPETVSTALMYNVNMVCTLTPPGEYDWTFICNRHRALARTKDATRAIDLKAADSVKCHMIKFSLMKNMSLKSFDHLFLLHVNHLGTCIGYFNFYYFNFFILCMFVLFIVYFVYESYKYKSSQSHLERARCYPNIGE